MDNGWWQTMGNDRHWRMIDNDEWWTMVNEQWGITDNGEWHQGETTDSMERHVIGNDE